MALWIKELLPESRKFSDKFQRTINVFLVYAVKAYGGTEV